jgi:hypothetical protein
MFAAAADGTAFVIDLTKKTVIRTFRYSMTATKIADMCWDPLSDNYMLCAV